VRKDIANPEPRPGASQRPMNRFFRVALSAARVLLRLLFRIDDAQLARVPARGPLIIVTNHVNILEIPILFSHLQPRPVTGLVAASRWHNRLLRWLLDSYGAIPLHRGQADVSALRKALEMLEAGWILIIDPEGTRSGHGRLQQAHPGMVLLALRSAAPVLPLVHYGSEGYQARWRRLQRPELHMVVGEPFCLDAREARVTRQMRRQMIDEVMYRMAALLPPAYRGFYSDLGAATETYIASRAI
jgi:1-acyl-sn-glycerol-3-phosphate acyltransferase